MLRVYLNRYGHYLAYIAGIVASALRPCDGVWSWLCPLITIAALGLAFKHRTKTF